MKINIAIEHIAPLHKGIQIFRKICHSPAPSICAASITETGILRIYLVSRNTAKGEKIPGSQIAQLDN